MNPNHSKQQQSVSNHTNKVFHTLKTSHKYERTYLLNVAIKAEEVEDAGAVHLGWMEAAHHCYRAGGVAGVRRRYLRHRVGHHIWNVHRGELVPAAAGQRQ